jgi:hypothetical protein
LADVIRLTRQDTALVSWHPDSNGNALLGEQRAQALLQVQHVAAVLHGLIAKV